MTVPLRAVACSHRMVDGDDVVARVVAMRLKDPADPRWPRVLPRLLPGPDAAAAFVAWAQSHPKWQFNVAEVAAGVCAKPVQAAIAILCDIAAECLDDEPV